jgi:hypothetical protein
VVQTELRQLRARVDALEKTNKRAQGRCQELEAQVHALRQSVDGLRARLSAPPTIPRTGPGTSPPVAKLVRIKISCQPPGASVYVDGRLLGVTPFVLQRPAASKTITVRVEKPGYRAQVARLRPDKDQVVEVSLVRHSPGR